MRTIKSIWTRPKGFFFEGQEECACHSILRTIKFEGICEIFTDYLGGEWLKALKLPLDWSKVSFALNDLKADGHIWAEGKIFTNAIQDTPYLQTDLDVMMGRAWPERVRRASVVCERHYFLAHDLSRLHLTGEWEAAARRNDFRSFACGSFGGCDTKQTKRIALAGLEFLRLNRAELSKRPGVIGSLIAEEWGAVREVDWMEVTAILPANPQGNLWAKLSKAYNHQVGVFKKSPAGLEYNTTRLEQLMPGQSSRCREVRKTFASVHKPD